MFYEGIYAVREAVIDNVSGIYEKNSISEDSVPSKTNQKNKLSIIDDEAMSITSTDKAESIAKSRNLDADFLLKYVEDNVISIVKQESVGTTIWTLSRTIFSSKYVASGATLTEAVLNLEKKIKEKLAIVNEERQSLINMLIPDEESREEIEVEKKNED